MRRRRQAREEKEEREEEREQEKEGEKEEEKEDDDGSRVATTTAAEAHMAHGTAAVPTTTVWPLSTVAF